MSLRGVLLDAFSIFFAEVGFSVISRSNRGDCFGAKPVLSFAEENVPRHDRYWVWLKNTAAGNLRIRHVKFS